MSGLLANIRDGMGTLLVRIPKPMSFLQIKRKHYRRLSDLEILRSDTKKIVSDMNKVLREVSKNG